MKYQMFALVQYINTLSIRDIVILGQIYYKICKNAVK